MSGEDRQLALAHEFREASTGRPRTIRRLLRKYHLLEMPETWNQISFDHHVHDANTKGRKSPTHLIMDAWIKGIRYLGVIYYNDIRAEAASELMEAAEIMGIHVRIGIEFRAALHTKYVQLIWVPRGFRGREDFLRFLDKGEVNDFLENSREVVAYEKQHFIRLLHSFNEHHLPVINTKYGISVPPLDPDAFLESVGRGQVSLVHLAEFAHRAILPHLRKRTEILSAGFRDASRKDRDRIRDDVASFNRLDPEFLVEEYLRPDMNPSLPDLRIPSREADTPEILRLNPSELLDRLESLPCRSRITLNPSNLTPADVLEVLYMGKGRITHLEIYNVKDWAQDRTQHRFRINELRLVINSGNVVEAKRIIREVLTDAEHRSADPASVEAVREILRDLKTLLGFYSVNRLQSRLGSDSIGHSRHTRGMGLVVCETLPRRARREIRRDPHRMLPVVTEPIRHVMISKGGPAPVASPPASREPIDDPPMHNRLKKTVTWTVGQNTTTLSKTGNIATLGGTSTSPGNGLSIVPSDPSSAKKRLGLDHLNSVYTNSLKVLLGFVPAFLTFYLTKDWWLLAYFGALIWFGITGLRNILQSVVGGGGIRRSSLLHWKDLVSWRRVADSLLFTGFSVPLLDYLVKDQMLSRGFGITAATGPVMLYSIMALANGLYISSHNLYRGLPSGAVIGNFFRTILSIPVAVGFNFLILRITEFAGISPDIATAGLQLWAAIISKAASDCVAAVIEGTADRQRNLNRRRVDYTEKLAQIYDVYERLETAFPEQDILVLMESHKPFFKNLNETHPVVCRDMVIDSLDLLYFWMYQPRARIALMQILAHMSADEKIFMVRAQRVLKHKRLISEMLLNGLVGKKFELALAFYLSHADRYISTFSRLVNV